LPQSAVTQVEEKQPARLPTAHHPDRSKQYDQKC